MCHYLGAGLHGKQKRVKAQSESSKSVVNSVLISREMPVFPGFLEIIRVVTLSNSSVINLGNIKGAKGDKGDTGRGISSTVIENGELFITYTDGQKVSAGYVGNANDYTELIYSLLPNGTYGVKAGGKAKDLAIITIPETYKGIDVTEILSDGFKELTNLKQLNMPNTIKVIGDNAFYNCINLASFELSENLESIGRFAFKQCYSFSTAVIPNKVTFIGKYAFYDSGISSLTLPTNRETWYFDTVALTDTKYDTIKTFYETDRMYILRGETLRLYDTNIQRLTYSYSLSPKKTALLFKGEFNTGDFIIKCYQSDLLNKFSLK